jgi:hypothetical protein
MVPVLYLAQIVDLLRTLGHWLQQHPQFMGTAGAGQLVMGAGAIQ